MESPYHNHSLTVSSIEPFKLYQSLRSWQTRVLRLHRGAFGSPISCDLVTVDLIYFEGAVMHGATAGNNALINYDALSYTWGMRVFPRRLTCNKISVPITENLHSALQRIRLIDKERYLWVDAVCINQEDNDEKAVQVQNMLSIFMKAKTVFALAWRGRKEHPKNN